MKTGTKIERSEKREERKVQREARGTLIDKLVAGETLTTDEETMRTEVLARLQDDSKDHKEGSEIIEKILLEETLTDSEQEEFDTMQADRIERQENRAIAQPIIEKKRAGETLTDSEQSILDELKANHNQDGRGGKCGK